MRILLGIDDGLCCGSSAATEYRRKLKSGVGYGPLLRDYVYFLLAKLAFHRQHPEFNGLFEYEEYISLKSINDPNEG